MKNSRYILFLLCALAATGMTGCKEKNTPEQKQVAKRHLTIKMQESEGLPIRQIKNAVINDLGTTLSAEWTAGDKAAYCNLSRQDYNPMTDIYTPYAGELTATTTGVKSNLNGDVECIAEDYLAVVYPNNTTFTYNSTGSLYSYTFPLTGQNGTLELLASNYHQQYGRAHVTSVSAEAAEAVMAKMESLLTVCKFSFKDATTNDPIPVGTLSISYKTDDSENGKYPQTGKVTVKVTDENSDVNAEKHNVTAPLTITCVSEMNEVYVALMPTLASRTYTFTVTNTSGTYSGVAKAWLKKGEYVPATGLKLTKQP